VQQQPTVQQQTGFQRNEFGNLQTNRQGILDRNPGLSNAAIHELAEASRAKREARQGGGGAFTGQQGISGRRGSSTRGRGLSDPTRTLTGRDAGEVSRERENRRSLSKTLRGIRGSGKVAIDARNDAIRNANDRQSDFDSNRTAQERNSIYREGNYLRAQDRDLDRASAESIARGNAATARQERSDDILSDAAEVGMLNSKGEVSRFARSGDLVGQLKLFNGDVSHLSERDQVNAAKSAGRQIQWLGALGEQFGIPLETLESVMVATNGEGFERGGAQIEDANLFPFGQSGNVGLWDLIWNNEVIRSGNGKSVSKAQIQEEYNLPHLSNSEWENLTRRFSN
jgi:hypothetical protein